MMAVEIDAHRERDFLDDHPSLSASLEDFEHHGTYSDHLQPRSHLVRLPSHRSGFARSDDSESSVHSDSGSAFFPPGERRYGGPGSASASGILGWSTHRPYRRDSLTGIRASLVRSREWYARDEMVTSTRAAKRRRSRTRPENVHGFEEKGEGAAREGKDEVAEVEEDAEDETLLAARVRLPTDSPLKRSPSPGAVPESGRGDGDDGAVAASRAVVTPVEAVSLDSSLDERAGRTDGKNCQ